MSSPINQKSLEDIKENFQAIRERQEEIDRLISQLGSIDFEQIEVNTNEEQLFRGDYIFEQVREDLRLGSPNSLKRFFADLFDLCLTEKEALQVVLGTFGQFEYFEEALEKSQFEYIQQKIELELRSRGYLGSDSNPNFNQKITLASSVISQLESEKYEEEAPQQGLEIQPREFRFFREQPIQEMEIYSEFNAKQEDRIISKKKPKKKTPNKKISEKEKLCEQRHPTVQFHKTINFTQPFTTDTHLYQQFKNQQQNKQLQNEANNSINERTGFAASSNDFEQEIHSTNLLQNLQQNSKEKSRNNFRPKQSEAKTDNTAGKPQKKSGYKKEQNLISETPTFGIPQNVPKSQEKFQSAPSMQKLKNFSVKKMIQDAKKDSYFAQQQSVIHSSIQRLCYDNSRSLSSKQRLNSLKNLNTQRANELQNQENSRIQEQCVPLACSPKGGSKQPQNRFFNKNIPGSIENNKNHLRRQHMDLPPSQYEQFQ